MVIHVLVRLLLWLIFGFLIYTAFQVVKQMFVKPPPLPPEKSREGEDMVKDPECGTYVPRSEAVHLQHKGKQIFFCSKTCRDKFTHSG